jgi:hypothetical protein
MSTKSMLILASLGSMLFAAPTLAEVPSVAAKSKTRMAVIEIIDLPDRMEETRSKLRDLLEASVRQRGFDLIQSPEPPACVNKDCLPTFATSTEATDILLVRGGRSGSRGYHVELSLWHAASGEARPAVADCNFCTGPQMAEAVNKAAGPLLDAVPTEAPPALPPAAAAPPAAVLTPAVALAPVKVEAHTGRRILGWSIVGAGAVLGIVGGVIWHLDGEATDCGTAGCRNTYHTRGDGIGFVAAGAVAVGAGLWLALDPAGNRAMTVTLGPSGAVLGGRF